MEKLKIVLIILLFSPCLIKGQDTITSTERINGSKENIIYISGRIVFQSNHSKESIQRYEKCEDQKVYYFLNHLQISEKHFFELNLSNNMIYPSNKLTFYDRLMELLHSNTLRGRGYGIYDLNYAVVGSKKCIKEVILSVTTYIQIQLNGKIIDMKEQKKIFSSIPIDSIISIERKFSLFGTGIIEIITVN